MFTVVVTCVTSLIRTIPFVIPRINHVAVSVTKEEDEADEAKSAKKSYQTAADRLLSTLQSAASKRKTIDEVILYTEEQTPVINTNPLEWRKPNVNRYPLLFTLALKYLYIPGTSTPSERIFSKAGEIVRRRWASLEPSTVDALVFPSKYLPALD
jgi:hypothetical protein